MRRYLPGLLLLAVAGPLAGGPAAAASFKEARERWLRGSYEEAQELYAELGKDPATAAAAAVGLSRTLESMGQYDQALAAVEKALAAHPKDAGLLARRAELLYLRGRWDEAGKALDASLALSDGQFLARWVRAQILRDRGLVKEADAEMRWFVRTYSQRSFNDDDIKDPEQLVLVALAGAENARWHSLSDQFQFILDEVYTDALKYDPSYWPAEYQAGMLLLEKYNRPQALAAFDKALAINPSAAEALVGKGQAALSKMEYGEAESYAERALKINPRLPVALQLRADVHLAVGDTEAALEELAAARAIGPRDERTLGRIAACLAIKDARPELAALEKEVEAFDGKPALFYWEMGERLEERRRFEEAEKCFRKAIALRPSLPGPGNSLGLLCMRLGREEEGKEILTKAFDADPFNVRVSNMLKVIRHLSKYETLETAHFAIRHDPATDALLARYLGDFLERLYEDLARQFAYRPEGPILIEVFNNHEMFSGRTVALPDLHTIGACTGRIVTMVSPAGRGIRKPFSWGRVMRHELVHIFNLEQTRFLVPHWLTEGLAVSNEGFPRPPSWNELLRQRVPKGDLLDLETINLAFMRPRSPLEWHLAYCQSQLYVEYLRKTYGDKVIGELLAAYRDGLSTDAALVRACKVERAAFEKGYRAHLSEVVRELGGGAEKERTLAELKEAHEKDPADRDTAAALADLLLARDRVEARRLAEKVLAADATHPTACRVLARLARLAGDVKKERELLEQALGGEKTDRKVLLAVGKIYYDEGEYQKAADVLQRGRKAEPHEPEWLRQLARVYAQLDQPAKLTEVLRALVPTDADDLEGRLRLARLLAEAGDHAGVEKFAREALEIQVGDGDARKLLLAALRAQNRGAEADRLAELLGE